MSEQTSQYEIEAPTSFNDVYAINTELVRAVEEALGDGRSTDLHGLLEPLRSADFADLMVVLSRENRRRLVVVLGDNLDPEALIGLEGSILEDLLEAISPHAVARAISELDTDEAVHLLEEMDDNKREQVLSNVPAPNRAAALEGHPEIAIAAS